MDFFCFFIDRLIFVVVLLILIFIIGLIVILLLLVSEYLDVVLLSVQVCVEYFGVNLKVIVEIVVMLLEEVINGVENMMYMKLVVGFDGVLVIIVIFCLGIDLDQVQVQVQNCVVQVEVCLLEDVCCLGIIIQKQFLMLILVVYLFFFGGKYDLLYMCNYVMLKVKDELVCLFGVGQIQIFGFGEYVMCVWLDFNKVVVCGLMVLDVVMVMQE